MPNEFRQGEHICVDAFFLVVLFSAAAVGLFGCSGSPRPPVPTTPTTPCTVSVTITDASFNAAGGSATATVTTGANCGWSPDVRANSWIMISVASAFVGPATITLAVSPNRSFTARSGVLEIRDTTGAVAAAQAVTQGGAGCLYSITPTALALGGLGTSDGSDVGSFQARVHAEPSDCRWTATPNVPWMQLPRFSPSSGIGDGTISLAVLWNSSSTTRVGDVVIAGLSGVNPEAHLVVTQTSR